MLEAEAEVGRSIVVDLGVAAFDEAARVVWNMPRLCAVAVVGMVGSGLRYPVSSLAHM